MSEAQPVASNQKDPKEVLEKALNQRPNREELVDRNILPESNIAPSLMAAKKDLERSRLEDKLDNAIKNRPDPATLVKEGILNEDEVPQ